MYYILEIEIAVYIKEQLEDLAKAENLTLEDYVVRTLTDFLNDTEKVERLKAEYDALPDHEKYESKDIRFIRIFPVNEGESEYEARVKAILKENGRCISLPEITVSELKEHIDEEDFPLRYGNPVIINSDNGQKLVCLSWKLYERLMLLSGHDCEMDNINKIIDNNTKN